MCSIQNPKASQNTGNMKRSARFNDLAKTALISGITGQDGAFLARFLLGQGYKVVGLRPYTACDDRANIRGIENHTDFTLIRGDICDSGFLQHVLQQYNPDEIYNLAAMSHVAESSNTPEATANINGLAVLKFLEAIRYSDIAKQVRFYQASSSEMFGNAAAPQNEQTEFAPCSPYASAKLFAYWTVRNYRAAYGLHASNGILFNHESPLRGEEFVTRKITKAIAAIVNGTQDVLELGNLNAQRDWGHARDYVRGMWLMLQQDIPDDYVLASGQAHSVREFVNAAFLIAGVRITWQGEGLDERGIDQQTGRTLVRVNPQFFRPSEVHHLLGDASKARRVLGWLPELTFDDLVTDMMKTDLWGQTNQMKEDQGDDRKLYAAQ